MAELGEEPETHLDVVDPLLVDISCALLESRRQILQLADALLAAPKIDELGRTVRITAAMVVTAASCEIASASCELV